VGHFPFLTAKDIAATLKMSEDFVWKNSDKFGGQKFGYSWRYPHDAIERYLRNDDSKKKNKIGIAVSVRENGETDAALEPGDLPLEKDSGAGRSKSRRKFLADREDPLGFYEYKRKREAALKTKGGMATK